MLNKSAARMLGIETAAGQTVEIPERAFEGTYSLLWDGQIFRAKVAGIAKDFHFQTLREKIAPLVMAYQRNPVQNIDYFTSRVEATDIPGTLQKMEAALLAVDPDHPLEYHFLDEQLALFYTEDVRRQTMLVWASLAAIFIACMGLFGLATYAAEQRVKEIGVRNVLGASTAGIVGLLSRDYSNPVRPSSRSTKTSCSTAFSRNSIPFPSCSDTSQGWHCLSRASSGKKSLSLPFTMQ